MSHHSWTPSEIEILQKSYQEKINPMVLLPNRTYASIRHKASRLGLIWWQLDNICRECGIKLTPENQYSSSKIKRDRICKKCVKKQTEKIRKNNPERTRKWFQENYLHTNGSTYLCRKRPKPKLCELCKNKSPSAYHHYGEIIKSESIFGVWLCHRCHNFAELYDQGFIDRYTVLLGELR